jgi:hypothetical protein
LLKVGIEPARFRDEELQCLRVQMEKVIWFSLWLSTLIPNF